MAAGVAVTEANHKAAARLAGRVIEQVAALPSYVVVGGALLALINLTLIRQVIVGGTPTDWANYVLAGQHAAAGEPIYDRGNWFNYSPLLAYAFIALPAIGIIGWSLLHVLATAALPRPLGLIAFMSFPWWWDVVSGNVLTFILLPAAWALRGKGWAIAATFVIAMLIPRPLVVPLVLYLLWKYPAWRIRFVVIAGVVGLATIATGHALEWTNAIRYGAQDVHHYWNLSPSQFVGWAWLLMGVPLAVVLLRRGYVGLACLAASPYILPQYVLFTLLDLPRFAHHREPVRSDAGLHHAAS